MKAVSHTGKMQSARRRYRRRRYGGHPGERGPWFSWDTQDPNEYRGPEYDYEEEPWWSEMDVHVYLCWGRLLAECSIGAPVLPGGDSRAKTPLVEIPPSDREAGSSAEFRVVDRDDTPAVLVKYFEGFDDRSGDGGFFKSLRAQIPRVLSAPEVRIFRTLAKSYLSEDPFSSHAGRLISVLNLRPFWIRPITSWSLPDLTDPNWIESLVNHLLVQFPVPEFIKRGLWPAEEWPSYWVSGFLASKAAMWFILLARGVSLHRAAIHFDWVVPKGLVHWIDQAPAELELADATQWAEVMRLGGSPVEFWRLRGHHGFHLDVTDGEVNRKGHLKPLRALIHWLIIHRDELTDETCAFILEWYAHEFTEIQAGRPGASMKGRSVQGALAVARAYVEERNRPYVNYSWSNHGWDWKTIGPDAAVWTVRELTTGRELCEEGRALRHCVRGYAHNCAAGMTAIFSLQTNEKRRLTIEVSLPSNSIVQVRGVCNRPATSEEHRIVQRWRTEAFSQRNA